jgi:hypothetical protein
VLQMWEAAAVLGVVTLMKPYLELSPYRLDSKLESGGD